MQFVAKNVAKVELDSTSATVACNVARKVAPCVRVFIVYSAFIAIFIYLSLVGDANGLLESKQIYLPFICLHHNN